MKVTIDDIRKAHELWARNFADETITSLSASNLLKSEVYFKFENTQRTGSFKFRGAYNKISNLTADEKARGVVASSAGNHAQGVALSARWWEWNPRSWCQTASLVRLPRLVLMAQTWY